MINYNTQLFCLQIDEKSQGNIHILTPYNVQLRSNKLLKCKQCPVYEVLPRTVLLFFSKTLRGFFEYKLEW